MPDERIPMPRPTKTQWVDDGHVRSQMEPPLIGRRFSMIVSEEMLAQIGARGLEHAAERLGQEVAYRHQGDIQKAVDRYLFDGSWLRPIIEDELRRMAREFVLSLWSDDEKKNLRDWFDVFTAKCRNPAAAHETQEPKP